MHFGLIDGVMHQSQTKEPATLGRWYTIQKAYEGHRTRKTIELTVYYKASSVRKTTINPNDTIAVQTVPN